MNEQNFRSKFDRIIVSRFYQDVKQSLSTAVCVTKKGNIVYQFSLLELPWRINAQKTSRIPVGSYYCQKFDSPKHGLCFKVLHVVGRTDIELHKGNFYFQTEGCGLVGDGFKDINNDGEADVLNSGIVMSHLLNLAPERFFITFK